MTESIQTLTKIDLEYIGEKLKDVDIEAQIENLPKVTRSVKFEDLTKIEEPRRSTRTRIMNKKYAPIVLAIVILLTMVTAITASPVPVKIMFLQHNQLGQQRNISQLHNNRTRIH